MKRTTLVAALFNRRHGTAFIGMLAAAAWGGAAPATAPVALPYPVFAGTVLRLERVGGPVPWQDLDRILARREFAFTQPADPELTVQRPPASGRVYAVVHLRIEPGRTLGKYDYVLQCSGVPHACLSLAWDSLPYDARNWVAEAGSESKELRLLFEVPAATRQTTLTFALPVTLPQESVVLTLPGAAAAAEDNGAAPGSSLPQDDTDAAPDEPATPAPDQDTDAGSEWL